MASGKQVTESTIEKLRALHDSYKGKELTEEIRKEIREKEKQILEQS